MTQMIGQTINPSQKILDSESDACCFPEPWWKQDILTVRTSVKTMRPADSKQVHLSTSWGGWGQHHVRLKSRLWTREMTKEQKAASHLPRLKHPVAPSVIVHLVPPPQTNHQPPSDVLETDIRTVRLVSFKPFLQNQVFTAKRRLVAAIFRSVLDFYACIFAQLHTLETTELWGSWQTLKHQCTPFTRLDSLKRWNIIYKSIFGLLPHHLRPYLRTVTYHLWSNELLLVICPQCSYWTRTPPRSTWNKLQSHLNLKELVSFNSLKTHQVVFDQLCVRLAFYDCGVQFYKDLEP